MEYFHIEVVYGDGISSSDYSDYITVGIDKTISEIKDKFISITLLIFLIKTNNLDHKLFDNNDCEYWELTKEYIDELSINKKIDQIKLDQLPSFTHATHEGNVISLGRIQPIPEIAFTSLKGLFATSFTVSRDDHGYTYN